MQVLTTDISGVVILEPRVHRDGRGFFLESYHLGRYREAGIDVAFVQDNHSRSSRGVLRGLHGQRRRPQGKLVRVVVGEIFDVAVDVRVESETFGRHVGVRLDAESHRQLYVPPGLLHGFCVLSDIAEVEYKCTAHYDPEDEICLRWDDPRIGVDWPVREPILSEKDAAAPGWDEFCGLCGLKTDG